MKFCLLLLVACASSALAFLPPMPRGVGARSAVRTAPLFGHQVTIEMLDGKTHTINVESYKSVLEAALDEGIELPHDCKLGACLACSAKILSGTVDQTGSTLDDSLIEAGYALTCCAYPQSDVVIRSIPEDELIDEQFAPL